MLKKARKRILECVLHIFWMFPIDDRKVLFRSFRGQNCGDNPGAVFQEMKKERDDLKFYWVMKDPSTRIQGASVIRYGSISELYHLATAKVWIDNTRKGSWCTKRKGQYYVQTWHGDPSLKKVEGDIKNTEDSLNNAIKDSKNTDLFLSGSKWMSKLCKKSFFYKGNILEVGLPRTDILFENSNAVRNAIYEQLGFDENTQIVLYAPTFRKNGDLSAYNIDFRLVEGALKRKFGGVWKILVRLHPDIAGLTNKFHFKNVVDVSTFDDMNQLIVSSNVLITDYSSCMFDAMQAGKIIFLFASDMDEYNRLDRGFYFKMDELPFSFAASNAKLEKNIANFEELDYRSRVEQFSEQLGIFAGGHASEKVCEYIFKNFL
jgi:CDP-glycerol glycerophosphotransferase